jgi:hypothetical protein
VASALPRPHPAAATEFLVLLERRMKALERAAAGGAPDAERPAALRREHAVARRFLRCFEGSWDDGDENLVRGYLDRWERGSRSPEQAAAQSLVEAASALARLEARPGTLFCFLWQMESMLASRSGPC